MKKLVLIVLVLILVAAVSIKHLRKKHLVPVKTATVKYGDVRNVVEATGIIKPQVGAEVKVGARISGTVVKENVRVGDFVRKGDLIAVIDNRELKASLRRARANLENIKQTYREKIKQQELTVRSVELSIKKLESQLKAARSKLELKKWEFDREKSLFDKGYSTEERLRKARYEYVSSLEDFNSVSKSLDKEKLNLEIARRKLREIEKDYATRLRAAEEELKAQEIRLSYSYIYAPIDGVISYVSTQEGETVVAGLNAPEFVTILNPDRLENWVYVDETEIGKIEEGMKVEFSVDAYRGVVFTGVVEKIYPKPKLLNNVVYYNVVVRGFSNGGRLRPEMTTHNKIITGIKKHVLVVPNDAVKWKNGGYIVYKVDRRGVREVPVVTGWSDGMFTEIVSGLKDGDKVALSVRLK